LTADNRAEANKLLNKGSLAEKVNQLMLQEAERQEPPPKRLKSGNSEGGEVVERTALPVSRLFLASAPPHNVRPSQKRPRASKRLQI
jgi:hypothetical protein